MGALALGRLKVSVEIVSDGTRQVDLFETVAVTNVNKNIVNTNESWVIKMLSEDAE